MGILSVLRFFRKPNVKSLNRMEVSKKAFLSNYAVLRALREDAAFFPVVKSNAYGHGIEGAVKVLSKTDCEAIAVDSFVEYQFVRKFSKKDALVLGETHPENYAAFDLARTVFCIWNPETAERLGKTGKIFRIHIFLNTGMNREGVREIGLDALLAVLAKYPNLSVEGVCSHLSSADETDFTPTEKQIATFKRCYARIEAAGHVPTFRHIGASAGTLKIDDPFFNAFRPGIALYGFNPLSAEDPSYANGAGLKPVMKIFSTVTAVQEISAEEGVGYNLTHQAEKGARIAAIPFGYFEGLDRRLSNKGTFLWKKRVLPLVGRVCMNLSMADATGTNLRVGDEITVVSDNPKARNGVENLARETGTIPYEILVRFPSNMRRDWK